MSSPTVIRRLDPRDLQRLLREGTRVPNWYTVQALRPSRSETPPGVASDPVSDEGESDQSSLVSSGDRVLSAEFHRDADMETLCGDTQKFRLPHHGLDSQKALPSIQKNRQPFAANHDLSRDTMAYTPSHSAHSSVAIGSDVSGDFSSYFNSFNQQRTNSIYSLSRVSFSSQISQLTSLQLPQATSLSTSISAIPTSAAASKALANAADQIKRWISKASDVLNGLGADDDVEWAAAGGREGLGDVELAISRFEGLIDVYVAAIEELQGRNDIADVASAELKAVVVQMDTIMSEWDSVRRALHGVKQQVEMAMEWEELWNTVLGEIGQETEALGRLVFEMEETRHTSFSSYEAGNGIDIGELETIVEDGPTGKVQPNPINRFSLTPSFPANTPVQSPGPSAGHEDSNLLALFARMQPLRASLDFLPMRLMEFKSRAQSIFPTACEELNSRQENLEEQWVVLQKDADSLRRELGEDRWVVAFRNAGRQAQRMCDSVHRSIGKLRECLEASSPHTNPTIAKKIESYESKKLHYGPAIERVLAIIGRGVKDRLTINGEIIRLNEDTNSRWRQIESEMKVLDVTLDDFNVSRSQQLRDSLSSIISVDRSATASGADTPGSSPASSIAFTPFAPQVTPSTPIANGKSRPQSTITPQPKGSANSNRRYHSLPPGGPGSSHLPKKTPTSKLSSGASTPRTPRSSHLPTLSVGSTPSTLKKSPVTADKRPPWRYVSTLNSSPLGVHALKSSPVPEPNRRSFSSRIANQRPASRSSHIPGPSISSTGSGGNPFSPESPASGFPTPPPSNRSSLMTNNNRGLNRHRNPSASPARSSRSSLDSPRPLLRKQNSSSTISERRRSGLYETAGLDAALDEEGEGELEKVGEYGVGEPGYSQASPNVRNRNGGIPRPPSAMAVAGAASAMGKKASMPGLRGKINGARTVSAVRKDPERPPWR
ncbi:MAG: hypothetical protein M1814_005457 [Vezdaea aestivalis]|nr:MAG: hypothetical protein M1814_005457 [Vezdaea aestivalis]